MLKEADIAGKTIEEAGEICYLFAEKMNWDFNQIQQQIDFPIITIQSRIKLYMKGKNIAPTNEQAMFLMYSDRVFGSYNCSFDFYKKVIQMMLEDVKGGKNFDWTDKTGFLKYCCDLKINKGKEFCEQNDLDFNVVCKFSDE